jgi:hypothetical protein
VAHILIIAQEAEIRKIKIRSQPQESNSRDPISKKQPSQKRAGGVAQGVGTAKTKNKKQKNWF